MKRREHEMYIQDNIRERIPTIGGTKSDTNPTIWVKLCSTDCTWYVTEFDGEDCCFGYVVGSAVKMDYFLLSEIAGAGAAVSKDQSFAPKTLLEVEADHNDKSRRWPRRRPGNVLRRFVAWKSVNDVHPDVVSEEVESLASTEGEQ